MPAVGQMSGKCKAEHKYLIAILLLNVEKVAIIKASTNIGNSTMHCSVMRHANSTFHPFFCCKYFMLREIAAIFDHFIDFLFLFI